MSKKIGIVLSSGGVRGIAHIGLLTVLRELGVEINVISGASAGALVGALHARGYEPPKMLEFFKTTPLFQWRFYAYQKPGLLDTEKYRKRFDHFFPDNDFSALEKPLYVATTNIVAAQNEFFFEGPLVPPLLASAAVPVLFSPVEINGQLYADGGIMNNFPVEPLINQCDLILGSYVNPAKVLPKQHFTSSVKVLRRATELRLYADARGKFAHCNYVFEPDTLSQYRSLDSRHIDTIFELGYEAARKEADHILRALEGKTAPRVSLGQSRGRKAKRG